MDFWLTSFIGFTQFVLGVMGVYVALRPPCPKAHKYWITAFIVVGLVGVGATGWLAWRASESGEGQTKNILGDSEHPPFVAIISLPRVTRFVVVNPSDYPAYVARIGLRDDKTGEIVRTYGPYELAAHTASTDNAPWLPPSDSIQQHFTAEISTRNGLYSEEMMLKKDDNNQWARAVRVTQGMRTLEEDIDSAWPRNSDGSIDWKR